MPSLQLRFLGGFAASLGGDQPLVFPYDKVRALLAYLVMEPVEHSREGLAGLLWPDYPDEKARGNLRRCLFDLRQILDKSSRADEASTSAFLRVGKKTVGFNPAAPFQLDVSDFLTNKERSSDPLSALEKRSANYRGPFLAGLSLPDAPEFDAWLVARREKLHRDALAVLEQLIREHESRNAPDRALEFAQQAIELDFWREPLQRTYLRLLARKSQAAALAHFDVFRRALDDEIGVAPDNETLQLLEEIRRGNAGPADTGNTRSERRRVVAMVCDIEIAGNDPEHVIERQAKPLTVSSEAIRQRNGHVAQAQSGEIIAYFGYPSAREHAPREAMDAALDIATRLSGERDLAFRIGLHSGWILGSNSPSLPDEAGIVSKTARRLALGAPTGRIAVSPEMRLLVDSYCRFDTDPNEGTSVVSSKNLIARRIDRYRERLTTLVGRHRELATLTTLWSEIRLGARHNVLIRGEAGLGKSRLTHALVRHVGLSDGLVLELACQPESAHTPYSPFIDYLVRMTGLNRDDTNAASREKADAFIAAMRLKEEVAPSSLLELLGFPGDEAGDDDSALTQAARKQADEKLLLAVFAGLARSQAALLIVEDIHWADQASLEFLPKLAASAGGPLLLLCTSRQGQNPAVNGLFSTEIDLPPLTTFALEELVGEVAGGGVLGESQIASIIGRADGVPLYAEELTLSMLTGVGNEIPTTLWDTLATRLDNVGPAKVIAQQAAVIGRGFTLELLQAIADADADAGLKTLLHAGLVQEQRAGQYRFRHSLIRDVAYHSLALSERRAIHLRLANALRDSYANRLRDRPEVLAQHLSAAIDPAAAAVWLLAGSQAAARSANSEAIADFYAGLAALQPLAENDPQRCSTELQLQVALGTVLIAAEGYGSETAKSCFIRAWALSENVPDNIDLFPMMWGLWLGGRSCDNDVEPLAFARKLERTAAGSDDPAIRMAVDYAYGNNYFWLGEIERSRQHLESALANADRVSNNELIARYGENIAISSRAFLAWVFWMQGDLDGARQLAEHNVAQARQANHAHTLGYALCFLAVTYRHLRRPDLAAQASQELLAHAQQHDLLLWQAAGASILGWSMGITGNEAGLSPIEQGIAGARIAMRIVETTFMAFLADVLVHLNKDNALEVIDYALERAGNNHDVYYVPEFLRLQGEAVLLKSPEHISEATELFRQARQLAVSASSHTQALRCAVSQSRLLFREGKAPEAISLLEAARQQVSGSPDYPDLHDADSLLTQIRQSLS
jgi:DNA-binding SARP family transcriptional activator